MDLSLVEQQVRAFQPFQGLQAEGQGTELSPGLQHGDVEGPLQFFGGGGAAGAAADHKCTFHRVCSCHESGRRWAGCQGKVGAAAGLSFGDALSEDELASAGQAGQQSAVHGRHHLAHLRVSRNC